MQCRDFACSWLPPNDVCFDRHAAGIAGGHPDGNARAAGTGCCPASASTDVLRSDRRVPWTVGECAGPCGG
jgi:hypothetical protein